MSTAVLEQPKALINLNALKKKPINLAIFGRGNVGATLIDQILERQTEIAKRRDLELNIFCIANSTKAVLRNSITGNWDDIFQKNGKNYTVAEVIAFAKELDLKNCIAIDNTADLKFVENYTTLIANGFHIVSSNKMANTSHLSFYKELREVLEKNQKEYLYETNVGAGLPLIDTIKLLHLSGENITRIRGVFSGSLSYIFNEFSEKNLLFSSVLKKAIEKGFTEPDPREDLCGNDVARKLLILARELDLHNEFEDVFVQNLIPKEWQNISKETFLKHLEALDVDFQIRKKNLGENEVLRYVADLRGDLSKEDGAILEVQLQPVPKSSALGNLQGSDSLFEIYTESYGQNPIVIQGAGAGAKVTARGVFGDILRLSDKIN
ncbi:MAG: aspartate kinase [Flavobacteriaceae bacterium]|nr:aspartate kinase [Flavobacteriaceae bacterium]